MDEILLEAFRHNVWATKELLAACRGLTKEQLEFPGTAAGTERGILAIFNHIIQSDRGYASRRGDRPEWVDNEEDADDLAELERRADENAEVWERFLSQPLEATKLICAIMTGLGKEPPDIQAWSNAQATGHARERTADA